MKSILIALCILCLTTPCALAAEAAVSASEITADPASLLDLLSFLAPIGIPLLVVLGVVVMIIRRRR